MAAPKSTKMAWVWVLTLLIITGFIYYVSGILLPFIAALVLAYALNPSVERLEKWGAPRVLSTILVVSFLFLLIGLFLFGAVPFLKDELSRLVRNLPNYTERAYDAILPILEKFNQWQDFSTLQEKLSDHVGDMVSWGIKVIVNILTGGLVLANLLSLVVITPILVFYLLRDWQVLLSHVEKNLPKKYTKTIIELGKEMNRTLGGYARGQAIVCMSLAVVYITGLWLVGLDYAFTVGLISGILAFIPYVGFLTGLILALSLALAQFSDWTSVGLVAVVYAVGQALESTLLTPKLVGDRIGLHPVWIIFALLAGGSLFGFIGVLLALPLAAMLGVLIRAFMRSYRASAYYKG